MLKKCQNTWFTDENHKADDDPSISSPSPVCPLNTSPCVRSIRPRECRHHTHMLKHMCAWCQYTRGRLERTHGDVLSGHTGFFSVSHTTHHIPPHRTHRAHHNSTTTTPHGERQRQTETEREKEDTEREKERQRREPKEKREDSFSA